MCRIKNIRCLICSIAICAACTVPGIGSACVALPSESQPITTASLLEEMVDRHAITKFPDPAYTCRQFSSYDRNAKSPDQDWFANGDANKYLRTEENDGRTEWVMMDTDGPGAVVRIWSANPPADGTLRIYLDGNDTPALAASMTDLLGGKWKITSPLSAVRSRGWNLYLPIPYSDHCKITCDKPNFYYQVNYRTYEEGTVVTSFTESDLSGASSLLEQVQTVLVDPPMPESTRTVTLVESLDGGAEVAVDLPSRNNVVQSIEMRVFATDIETALRTTIIRVECDGKQTVWCPLGDFFGSGIGLNEYSGWWSSAVKGAVTQAGTGGTLTSRWIMPYQRSCRITLHNLGEDVLHLNAEIGVERRVWDDESMHFYAVWRQENPIHTRPMSDWNYVEVQGKGVFVGDVLAIANPVETWWGEGDEKIYVDGETFPSHFGTGTEDYYGYAWCCPEIFEAPFHAQPRCDGPQNYGHTTVSRVRTLDAIPFSESFKFDMEVWHWKECDVGYAATSFFYALPGATHNRPPQPDEAARGPINPPPLPPPFVIEGAIEAESMRVIDQTPGISVGAQAGFGPDIWSGDQHLWVQAKKVGDFVELEISVDDNRPRNVVVYATRSWDYAITRFFVNGKRAGTDQNLYNTDARAVASTGPIDLGVATPKDGRLILRAEVVGSHAKSEGTGTFFGIDCVVLLID